MRVLQLIDSLAPGGAERIAVTFANGLVQNADRSYLFVTRAEGSLKPTLKNEVGYLFLRKKKALDLSALLRLKKFVKNEHITIIHAHTTSYFLAALLKLIYPKVTIFWHEHQGNRVHKSRFDSIPLLVSSLFFDRILTVNHDLATWCQKNLWTKRVNYLSNFVDFADFKSNNQDRKNIIICVANLKAPKNHLNLLEAFNQIHQQFPDWQLQLIGKDFDDDYSNAVHNFINANNLAHRVMLLGSSNKARDFMKNAKIGVLSSDDEGLPMVLLEYGASGLAVVATQVGHCEEVISTFGETVPPNNPNALGKALAIYMDDDILRQQNAESFRAHVNKHYSLDSILPELITFYKEQ